MAEEPMTTDVDIPPLVSKTCFRCVHYTERFCTLYEADIDSEIYAARDCTDFTTREEQE